MKRDWKTALAKLPPGLSCMKVAKRLRATYSSVNLAIKAFGYPTVDGRINGQKKYRKLPVEKVDWTKSNVDIANRWGVSRERVRFLRNRLGKPKINQRGVPVGTPITPNNT